MQISAPSLWGGGPVPPREPSEPVLNRLTPEIGIGPVSAGTEDVRQHGTADEGMRNVVEKEAGLDETCLVQ